ncbi:hypothetical protein QTP88_010392 [Uroleucon formosanum]
MAACIIHNLLREEQMVCPMDSTDRDPITDVQTNTNIIQFDAVGGNATHEAFRVRETFKDYFNSRSGSVKCILCNLLVSYSKFRKKSIWAEIPSMSAFPAQ